MIKSTIIQYFLVLALLMLLLGATVCAAALDLGPFNNVLALLIAVTKAILVAFIFMHLRHADGRTRIFAAAGIVWLAILFSLTLSDYFTRGWTPRDSGTAFYSKTHPAPESSLSPNAPSNVPSPNPSLRAPIMPVHYLP
jgi:cytochrome c oxidase subunit 4